MSQRDDARVEVQEVVAVTKSAATLIRGRLERVRAILDGPSDGTISEEERARLHVFVGNVDATWARIRQ